MEELQRVLNPSVIQSIVSNLPSLSDIFAPVGNGSIDVDLCDLFAKLKAVDANSLPAPLANLVKQFNSDPCAAFRDVLSGKAPQPCNPKSDPNNNNNSSSNGKLPLLFIFVLNTNLIYQFTRV